MKYAIERLGDPELARFLETYGTLKRGREGHMLQVAARRIALLNVERDELRARLKLAGERRREPSTKRLGKARATPA